MAQHTPTPMVNPGGLIPRTPITPIRLPPIHLPPPPPIILRPPPVIIPLHPLPIFKPSAPAWFYSALAYLGQSYQDGSGIPQNFTSTLYGSDCDPYSQLGQTSLFIITLLGHQTLSLQYDSDLDAVPQTPTAGTQFAYSDDGILSLYQAIAASAIFSSLKYCYIPCLLSQSLGANIFGLTPGYDPTSGIRVIVSGSAVSQVVPLDAFVNTQNEQIYNETPSIVPLVSALVYDIGYGNKLSATSFVLPIFYTVEQVSGNVFVNRFESTTVISNTTVRCGQTLCFTGGPGFDPNLSTNLTIASTVASTSTPITGTNATNNTLYTYDYGIAKATTVFPGGGWSVGGGSAGTPVPVDIGVVALNCTSLPNLALFSTQRILGFYRKSAWSNCLGVPVYDYGSNNGSFTIQAIATDISDPTLLYDPTIPYLNGGSLPNVVKNFWQQQSQHPIQFSQEQLVGMLRHAITGNDSGGGAGFSVTSATLNFNLTSPQTSGVVSELSVPIIAKITTTPPRILVPPVFHPPIVSPIFHAPPVIRDVTPLQPAPEFRRPSPFPSAPTTVQVGLTASVPREALADTGILSFDANTPFQLRSLGSGSSFQSLGHATVINLVERDDVAPSYPPYDLALITTGANFAAETYYVLSLTGPDLTIRSPQATSQVHVGTLNGVNSALNYIGAMVFTTSTTSVRLYPKLQLSLPSPAAGTQGVVQGQQYNVRLTFGASNSQYDIIDTSQNMIASAISIPNPAPLDESTPHPGDVYVGSFRGGDKNITVWLVPVFLSIAASQLPKDTSYWGSMALSATTTGTSSYKLQITDSSIHVYTDLNVDTGVVGSLSPKNIFLATATINSSPDDLSSNAFAPSPLLLGIVQQVQMKGQNNYVFIPEKDSVVIGGTRYMVSVVEFKVLDLTKVENNPNDRPYPPSQWYQTQFWQFVNRHNPFRDVKYTGAVQTDRTVQAQSDLSRIGAEIRQAQEPMHMFLDTSRDKMKVWPVYHLPFPASIPTIDIGQLQAINGTILSILKTPIPARSPFLIGELDAEQITVPAAAFHINNPFTYGAAASDSNPDATSSFNQSMANLITPSTGGGLSLTHLSPNTITSTPVAPIRRPNILKQQVPNRMTDTTIESLQNSAAILHPLQPPLKEIMRPVRFQPIFGWTVYNPSTLEAYIVELVNTDMDVPNQLPSKNSTYDPYYVRVVFLNSLKSYNMSIIVPSMVYDHDGNLAHQKVNYSNLLSKTNELNLGYMYSLYDSSNTFDTFNFTETANSTVAASQSYLFTNYIYKNNSSAPTYFFGRRENWNKECHLIQATNSNTKSAYLSFGAGDIIPLKLDPKNPSPIDSRQPSYMAALSHKISDRQYDAVKTISVANIPYMVGASTQNGVLQFTNFSLNTAVASGQVSDNQALQFPTECYVVGLASTTLTSVVSISGQIKRTISDTSQFVRYDSNSNPIAPDFKLLTYNNLVYMVRLVSNVQGLAYVGGINVMSGLLIDTFVPSKTGHLNLAQAARYKRSGLSFFGSSYTPTTMVDSLDTLDFTSITGQTFYAPTMFVPIPEADDSKGFFADLSNFLGQQIWTFVYSEIVAHPGAQINGATYPNGLNLDNDGKPILSLQMLHFVYDPLVVMYTSNDLSHKYRLLPKQQILALTNGQIAEGISWRSANLQTLQPLTNVSLQQIIPDGPSMDRPNIIYSSHNRPVTISSNAAYKGMSVNSILSVSGVTYNAEESAMAKDQVGSRLISTVSSTINLIIAVLFDYDNDSLGSQKIYNQKKSSKGIVLLSGFLSAKGYTLSSPDHFDVNDVLPSQGQFLEQISEAMGENWDISFYNTDISLPRQFWSMSYDAFTPPGLTNYISNVPPAPIDPAFTNRLRSLVLSLGDSVQPDQLGLMDTYSSVVSVNMHMQNGIIGSVYLNKKAERDIITIGSNSTTPLTGLLPAGYDFYIFSRDHSGTLSNGTFDLIDQGYAMCLVDDGSGTGQKVAQFYIDADGNYYELYNYILSTADNGIVESSSFILKVILGSSANNNTVPATPATPNNVDPQELVKYLNRTSQLVYATFGATSPGQPAAFLPIQVSGGEIKAAPINGAPGFNGYNLNAVSTNRQPIQISQIYSGAMKYPIAGATTIRPIDLNTGSVVPFYGSISHGIDRLLPNNFLPSVGGTTAIPRSTGPVTSGYFGGNGLGALTGTMFCSAFQGSPPVPSSGPTAGSVMRGDDTVFYTYNAVSNTVLDSAATAVVYPAGGQYFIDSTADPSNPIYGTVTFPSFTLQGNLYTVNLSTTLSDGTTSRYSLVIGEKSYLFSANNSQVVVDRTLFTFNAINHGFYTVSYAAIDSPAGKEAPQNVSLIPFSIAIGGKSLQIDVFTPSTNLQSMMLGVTGHLYTYDPIHGTITISHDATTTIVPLQSGLTYTSPTSYGYVIAYLSGQVGSYAVNGSQMYPYPVATSGNPANFALMTSPKIFVKGGNFYTFDQDINGYYLSVTGNGQTYPVNSYQFSLNGVIYIINSNVQPNAVLGGGNVYPMTALNTQFIINGMQYTALTRSSSFSGATISGQFNITRGNVIAIENYIYQLDTLNGQIVGNGTTYPLTSGFTYTITTADRSFTVITEPNSSSVTIGSIVYQINNNTIVGDGVEYPVLQYRSFQDNNVEYNVGLDGTVSIGPVLSLAGDPPYTGATFTDGTDTFTVNTLAATDGSLHYFLITGVGSNQFSVSPTLTYTIRTNGAAINTGSTETYFVTPTGLNPGQIQFGSQVIEYGAHVAAFDGQNYYSITNNQFPTLDPKVTFTLSGNTAVHAGNSYEIFSNLGQEPYFQVPGGATYFVNIPISNIKVQSTDPNAVWVSGDLYNAFPMSGTQFTVPLKYTISVSGSTVAAISMTLSTTATPGSIPISTLTAAGGTLTGGNFVDPVTKITYNCINRGGAITFIDSNNTVYQYSGTDSVGSFTALVNFTVGITLALDNQTTPNIYPVTNNQFITPTSTYTINLQVAYENASGPYWLQNNGQFTIPKPDPISDTIYTIRGGTVTKGFVISSDDQVSVDGVTIYTINSANIPKTVKGTTLTGTAPTKVLTSGTLTYNLQTATGLAGIAPTGLLYDSVNTQFTVSYNGVNVTFSIGSAVVLDDRNTGNAFIPTVNGNQFTFQDGDTGVTFTFDNSGNNQITVEFQYTNNFFIDSLLGITYFVDELDNIFQAITYLPETIQYGFVPSNGIKYSIHYNNVRVEFPVISGSNVDAGVATVGSDQFSVNIDKITPDDDSAGILVNKNSFEINGNLYTIAGTPTGANYSTCRVIGGGMSARSFTSANTFVLTDSSVIYTLHLDSSNLPLNVTASFAVRTSRSFVSVNDNIYVILYAGVSTGSIWGQGSVIPINDSSFTLNNHFDSRTADFAFADLNIYDAASVIGEFPVYYSPTFLMGGQTYSLNTATSVITDSNKRPFPLIPNPTMFSLNGFNYVVDSNQTPHAIVGNNNISPLSVDVTVQFGRVIPNSTFALNGLIYKYTEDALQNLLAIIGVISYPIALPAMTFRLDSSLLFTLAKTPPPATSYVGSVAPIGVVSAGTLKLNIFPGIPESGGSDFFTYKGILYILISSSGTYTAVQKAYTVYAAGPSGGQQQLAVFNLSGTTYVVTCGSTIGDAKPAGINPGNIWAATATSQQEAQFGQVYGLAQQPTLVTKAADTGLFQFQATDTNGITTLYDIIYTAGSNRNSIRVDIPNNLPTFVQTFTFGSLFPSVPLRFETGGYDGYVKSDDGSTAPTSAAPTECFSMAYRTPLTSGQSQIDQLISVVGDFTVEFWHSEPTTLPTFYRPFTYAASNQNPLIHYLDIGFENIPSSPGQAEEHNVYVQVNDYVMKTATIPPVLSSGSRWRHLAVTYSQPYAINCEGAGFEVADGSNYNFNQDFSIGITFLVADTQTKQSLLYKGAASTKRSPDASLSYMVTVELGTVKLYITTGDGDLKTFSGLPNALATGKLYELFIAKQTVIPTGSAADPYAPPFDASSFPDPTNKDDGATANVVAPPSGSGTVTLSGIKASATKGSGVNDFVTKLTTQSGSKSFQVTIALRTVDTQGGFGDWSLNNPISTPSVAPDDNGLTVYGTGPAHLVIGSGFDTYGTEYPLGTLDAPANIRQVYLFSTAVSYKGIKTAAGYVPFSQAGKSDLVGAGIVGHWHAAYDANGVVNNLTDPNAVAVSEDPEKAFLFPIKNHEYEGITLYLNGYLMPAKFIPPASTNGAMPGYTAGPLLSFNAGSRYRLTEISMWQMVRQQSQLLSDMFGRLDPDSEPLLVVYLPNLFQTSAADDPPILPLSGKMDNIDVDNQVKSMALTFPNVSSSLGGSPTVARCGPLITSNLYAPPGVALTVCDTVPEMTTYSITANDTTNSIAGQIFEAYVYVQNKAIMIYAGKKVGDLDLSWVSQEQGDVQMIGYVEGAPPAPMANLTNRSNYAGATSVQFNRPTSVNMRYDVINDSSSGSKQTIDYGYAGLTFQTKFTIAPFGIGMDMPALAVSLNFGETLASGSDTGNTDQATATNRVDDLARYTVKLQGTPIPVTNDLFMANLNTLTTTSTSSGSSKTAILPNPDLGGFTASNPPAQLPRVPVPDEKYGSRMFRPSPYGQAFVSSQTVDVYQQTLRQTGTVYGFARIPNAQIPRDVNIISFRMSSKYIRPGNLDGVVTYAYNPATLPSGVQTYSTSTGEMNVQYDKNFSEGAVGHDASYMRIIEAYKLKKQIDQQSQNAMALYQSAYGQNESPSDDSLTPALDFYNEYIWSARGGTQEVKHNFSTSYNEVFSNSSSSTFTDDLHFNAKVTEIGFQIFGDTFTWNNNSRSTTKYSYNTTGTSSFDVTSSFDGIDSDTQMRYASANDAHFVIKNNSAFNINNQSGLNLVIGSDGLVYNIVPSVSSGGGLPSSDDIDDSDSYSQPQPAYSSGNATGITGALEPYNRPGKTKLFRNYTYFLQPDQQNADDFWNTVVDPVWLANSSDSDAAALRTAQASGSIPWRLLHRITYSERFLPPASTDAVNTPSISPIMAVPVSNSAADFLYNSVASGTSSSGLNTNNDTEANVVLVAATASGMSAGTVPTTNLGSSVIAGQAILPNNVIPFELATNTTAAISWGDSTNRFYLGQLMKSILGTNIVKMTGRPLPGSTKTVDVVDPSSQQPVYSIYLDPNGNTINVPMSQSVVVYQDVNSNPIQYYDGKGYHSLQADYVASSDGTIMYYIQPPSTYDQSSFDLLGDYDLFGHPGDEWRYYLVSGTSSNMTSASTISNTSPFTTSSPQATNPFTGFSLVTSPHDSNKKLLVKGYLLVQSSLSWPHLNTNAEVSADVLVYKSVSLLDTFPIGDLSVMIAWLGALFPNAPFLVPPVNGGFTSPSQEVGMVMARNVSSYLGTVQSGLLG